MLEKFKKMLENGGFVDIEFNSGIPDATLLPYSNIRPFQKEKVRYFGITAIIPELILGDNPAKEPVIITCEREEEI